MTSATEWLPHFRADGPQSAPPLLLGPSLGTSLSVWDPQIAALAARHRVVRWDLPGHGGSSPDVVAGESAATVADIAAGVLRLADSLGAERFAYAGISLGGAVGSWLAVHHPERVESLALVCSSASFGPAGPWLERAALARSEGLGPIADASAGRWFTPDFAGSPQAVALVEALRTGVDANGYAACCEALGAFDLRAGLARITAPALVVGGRQDVPTPPAHSRELADGIPDASLTEVARAGHLANVERPVPVTAALLGHLAATTAPPSDDETRHAAGTAVRRAVLGDDHVDRAVARTSDFTAVFQDFITRYAWGEIWTRPGLSPRTRSCVTLTALVAHGHLDELALHVRAALRNGLTAEEVQEVLLQTAVYCGVPAANSAFAVADRVLREYAAETPDAG
jgi:3-oxoadipate enol-lactonase / 4-carboxymuconolactone decarboxylase